MQKDWDKTFPLSDKVEHRKVTFRNRYGITLMADEYRPKTRPAGEAGKKFAAVAVAGPFGAVKEQASGLYAEELAERGFLAIAFDPSFTGESSGFPRNVASPDINTEDFQAAVDYLSTREDVDPERVCIIGICGFGGMALNAAALDTRIKATVAATMYDMTRVGAKGYFDREDNADARYAMKAQYNAQRTEDYRNGTYASSGALPDVAPEGAPQFLVDYVAYYRTPRGFHPRSQGCGKGWNVTGTMSFMNQPILAYSHEIRSAVMVVHGEKAHSLYMGRDAFSRLTGDNKELVIVPGASHTDLYDQKDIIPFDRIAAFLRKYTS